MAVCVVGSINVDVIARVEQLPLPGETVMAHETLRLPGGKGANQAVAAARMGAAVRMVGAVGDDEAGRWMLAALGEAGVDVRPIARLAEASTGTAYIAVDARAENQIIVASGANARLTPAMLAPGDTGDVVLAQMEVPAETLAAAFAAPARLRILNAAPALASALPLFALVDVLIVNEHELAWYAGCAAAETLEATVETARTLCARADQVVIVTLGAAGAVAVWADRHFHAPALPVRPIDTVGAGDCFCGALAALLDEGLAIDAALGIANAAAGLCTLAPGAVSAMPARAAVEAACMAAAT
ncbi:ribokinase [Sphingomonas sp. CJ20]